MGRHIGELNRGLLDLQNALQHDPHAASKVRFSVISFSDDAFTHLLPADLRLAPRLPELTAQGGTSYCAAFEELIDRISVDIPWLKSHGLARIGPWCSSSPTALRRTARTGGRCAPGC